MHEVASPQEITLLIFSDDWGRHPSSCQHLTRRLLRQHPVIWVNTIGTRAPRLDLATARRVLQKLGDWFRARKSAALTPPGLTVLSPRMWPWFRSNLDRRLNRALLQRQLEPVIHGCRTPVVAVTTVPIVADLIGTLPVSRWVYYCVDDFSKWPGLDQEPLDRMERQLVARVDELIAVSEALRQRLADMGRESHLLTHGVDLELWSRRDILALPQLRQNQRPLIIFWGMVDRRLDTSLLKKLSEDLTEGTIVLVGPEQDPDPVLREMSRVVRLPAMSFDQLPALAQEAAVLIMPYADLPVTRAMQPLKLKEYLATDRPVVVADLPSTRPWTAALDLVRTPEEFSDAVRLRVQSGLPSSQRAARAGLVSESWTAKSAAFERLILGLEHELPTAAARVRV
ncbi:MAG: hypothetical protein ABSE84_02465 [Isosphaeraceae bacterium]|jgi:glycosyltransferase involved in cell wall biosynthesis